MTASNRPALPAWRGWRPGSAGSGWWRRRSSAAPCPTASLCSARWNCALRRNSLSAKWKPGLCREPRPIASKWRWPVCCPKSRTLCFPGSTRAITSGWTFCIPAPSAPRWRRWPTACVRWRFPSAWGMTTVSLTPACRISCVRCCRARLNRGKSGTSTSRPVRLRNCAAPARAAGHRRCSFITTPTARLNWKTVAYGWN